MQPDPNRILILADLIVTLTKVEAPRLILFLNQVEAAQAEKEAEKQLALQAAEVAAKSARAAQAAKHNEDHEAADRGFAGQSGFRARMGAFARAVTPTRWRRGSQENASIPSRSVNSSARMAAPSRSASQRSVSNSVEDSPSPQQKWGLEDMDDEL